MTFLALIVAVFLSCPAAPAPVTTTWITGEMGYRVTLVPEGTVAARQGLRTGDILAEPEPLLERLINAAPGGVELRIYRLNASNGTYEPAKARIAFLAGEEHQLGTSGELGFLVTAVRAGTLGARAELKAGDFIPKINETLVNDVADLALVDQAYDKGEQVFIYFTRWNPESQSFVAAVSRRRFLK